MNAIETAIHHAGGQSVLARACGVTPQYLNQIRKGRRPVSLELATAIEKATAGAVTRLQLLYPDESHPPEAGEAA